MAYIRQFIILFSGISMKEADQNHIEELLAVKYLSFMTFRYKQGVIFNL